MEGVIIEIGFNADGRCLFHRHGHLGIDKATSGSICSPRNSYGHPGIYMAIPEKKFRF